MQRRLYKRAKRKSSFSFVIVCILLVVLVAALCAFLARCGRDVPPEVTTVTTTDTESEATIVFTPPETSETQTTETSVPDTEVLASAADTTVDSTAEETTTFTSVSEIDGVRRIENFIFYDKDTPEYRLAELLYCEVPTVVKTAEVTETVAIESTDEPLQSTEVTTTEAAETSAVGTDETAETSETTVETYTYEVEGYAALYYEDLTDGEIMVFAPNKTIFGASMIKAVYVYALLQLAEREEIDLSEEIIYKESMFVEGSGDFKNVKDGTSFTVEELAARTVRRSDNTAFAMLQKRFGTAFFSGVMEENALTPTRFGSWWRTNVSNYGAFFRVLSGYLMGENKYGAWLADNMCESLQSVMLQRALRPEKVAHKYGWDEDSYCDGAVVLSDKPYVLVFMSNLDEGHLKAKNTSFIYEVGGIVKAMHDAKHAALVTAETTEE